MIDDEQPLTPDQVRQAEIGSNMAISAAVHALIASHPAADAFEKAFQNYLSFSDGMFLTTLGLQKDQGMRQAYSSTRRSLWDAVWKEEPPTQPPHV